MKQRLKKVCVYLHGSTYRTFMIIRSSVTVFMQQLFHAAECDGSEVTRVFQLEEALQVGCCLTPCHVHTLTVDCIQPRVKIRSTLCSAEQTVGITVLMHEKTKRIQ